MGIPCFVFNKDPGYVHRFEKICEHYKTDYVESGRCVINRSFFKEGLGLTNWQSKRFVVDLSYLGVLYGIKPIRGITNKIVPSVFVRELTKGLKVHRDSIPINKSSLGFNKEELLKIEKETDALKLGGEKIVNVINTIEKCKKNVEEDIKDQNKGSGKGKRSRKLRELVKNNSCLENYRHRVIDFMRDKYLTGNVNEIEKRKGFSKVAKKENVVTEIKEEENVNKKSLTYKNVFLDTPCKLNLELGNKKVLVTTTEAFEETWKIIKRTRVKNVIESEDQERRICTLLELSKIEEELKETTSREKGARDFMKERRRALKMVESDIVKKMENSQLSLDEGNGIWGSVPILKHEVHSAIKSCESSNRGSRFRILKDSFLEDLPEPFKGKIYKKEIEKPAEECKVIGNLPSYCRYRLNGELNKYEIAKKKKKNPNDKSKNKGKNKNKSALREKKRNQVLTETGAEKSEIQDFRRFFNAVRSIKGLNNHTETKNPIYSVRKGDVFKDILTNFTEEELNFNERKQIKEAEEENKRENLSVYEWVDEQVRKKILKFRGFKLIS